MRGAMLDLLLAAGSALTAVPTGVLIASGRSISAAMMSSLKPAWDRQVPTGRRRIDQPPRPRSNRIRRYHSDPSATTVPPGRHSTRRPPAHAWDAGAVD